MVYCTKNYQKDKVEEGNVVKEKQLKKWLQIDKYSSSYDASNKDGYVCRCHRKEWDATLIDES